MIKSYNPKKNDRARVQYALNPNEELFGVYGVKNAATHLISFGFIVKVSQD